MPRATIQTLLTQLIDYAGLFPPAKLAMRPAVEEYARVRASGDAWALARFIVPFARLTDFEDAARDLLTGADDPWPLSVLAGADPEAESEALDAFHQRCPGARAEAIETRADTVAEVARKASAFANFETYIEIPHHRDPTELLEAIAKAGARAKIRTGGITEDALPPAAEVARFIAAAARVGATFKATAGLHHPLRGAYRLTYAADAASGTMHGYLNLFLAAALASRISEDEIVALLEERDHNAFTFTDESVGWRGHSLGQADLTAARKGFATSYGSCSFREPLEEIRALGLL